MRNKVATSFDVARLAGVSRSAVSRSFTEGASVAPETRQRVLEAAATLRYRPNLAARSLITRRSMIVALAVSHLDNLFYPKIVEHLSIRLAGQGYRLLLYVTHGDENQEPLVDELTHFGVDGLILASRGIAPDLLAQCEIEGIPVVMMNNARPDSSAVRVVGENGSGASQVARFLLAGAHRKFAFLAGERGVSSCEERLEGYAGALTAAGMPPPQIIEASFEFDSAYAACERALIGEDCPEALFCANDHMAFAALQAARRNGLRVAERISIVGFDNVSISEWPDLDLTSFSQSSDDYADLVVQQLTKLMNGEVAGPLETLVPGRLIVRNSARIPSEGLFCWADGNLGWTDRPQDLCHPDEDETGLE